MSEIPEIGINDIDIGIPDINMRQIQVLNPNVWTINVPTATPPTVPVTSVIGKPIVDMPGCVEAHSEDDGKANTLKTEDPKGVRVYCDAGTPSFNPMDYEPEQLVITRETPPPKVDPPPDPDVEAPDPVTDIPKTETKEDPPCPPPNAPRIGDVAQSGEEAVAAYELQVNPANPTEKICVTIYEDLTVVEKYLPSVPVVTTTAGIAAAATTSALLAKPLADLLLKVVKPVVKKVIAKVNAIRGKEEKRLSVRERLLAQRDRNRAIMELRKSLKK